MSELAARLLDIPGVNDAVVDLGEEGPVSVRIELDEEAYLRGVGEAVQDLLSTYGMRSRLAPARSRIQPIQPPAPPRVGAIRSLGSATDEGEGASEHRAVVPLRGAGVAKLAWVAVVEGGSETLVSASSTTGERSKRRAASTRDAVAHALVAVVAELVVGEVAPPILSSWSESNSGDELVVTVMLSGEHGALAGSALVRGSWAFAFARAVWSALNA